MPERRSCGDCTVCCIVPGIDTPQIQKVTGAACRNCRVGGCAIYDDRPRACRDFRCAWLDGALDEDWRPDVSGVLAQGLTLEGRPGMSLMLIADAVKTVRQGWFVDYVQAAIQGGAKLLLALPGPRGTRSAKLLLNTPGMVRAAAGSPEQVRQQLRQTVKPLRASSFEPLPLLTTGNDVSG